jgi:hypothetical protein
MERNMVTLVVVAVVGVTGADFDGRARGQSTGPATQNVGSSVGQAVLHETFDDNVKNSMWAAYAQDPDHCQVVEVSQRLELRASPGPGAVFAGYLSQAWRLDPTRDFSMKVDAYFRPRADATGWLSLGVTPNADEPCSRHVSIGLGCAGGVAQYWYEKQEGLLVDSSRFERFKDTVTLYLSYDAATDLLFLSDTGYGAQEAWKVIAGVVRGQWGGRPLHLVLGGGSEYLTLGPGDGFLDNLLVETGTPVAPALQEVYRFWSPVTEKHFYTASKLEKDKLLTECFDVWTYEGVVYHALQDDSDPASRPVHRFWSGLLGSHFYTIDDAEKDNLVSDYPYVWTYEGVAWYAYPPGQEPPWSKPVYRFWSAGRGAHFYTIDEGERDRLLDKYPDVWAYEGVAWYALE